MTTTTMMMKRRRMKREVGNEMNEWMIRMHLHGQWVDGIKWHARQCYDRRNEQTNEGY